MSTALNAFLKIGFQSLADEFGDGINVQFFNTYRFFEELYLYPDKYYNGTAPISVTGHCHQCPNASDWHYCGM